MLVMRCQCRCKFTCQYDASIGKVMFECLYGDAIVGANTLASMMQAWLVVKCGVADLDVCLLSRVRCGNGTETKGAKTTHRRLCNRGISQHRAANHSTCFQTTKKRIYSYFSFSSWSASQFRTASTTGTMSRVKITSHRPSVLPNLKID